MSYSLTMTTTYSSNSGCGEVELTVDLPSLTGSDKQIAWATDIRRKAIAAVLDKLTESPAAAKRINEDPRKAEILSDLATEIASHADARYWIDSRGNSMDLIRAAAKRTLARQ